MLSFYGLRSVGLKFFQLYIMVLVIIDFQFFCAPDIISLLWYQHGIDNQKGF